MNGQAWPLQVYVIAAGSIALTAFLVSQLVPGAGMIVVAGGSTLWTAYAAYRHGKWRNHIG